MASFADGDKVKILKGTFAGKQGEVVSFRVKRPDGSIGTYEGSSLEPWVPVPVESPAGTTITPGSGTIVDSAGRKITVGTDGKVYREGSGEAKHALGTMAGTSRVTYTDQSTVLSRTGSEKSAWRWNDSAAKWDPVAV